MARYQNIQSQGIVRTPNVPTHPMKIPVQAVDAGEILTVCLNREWLRRVVDVISYMDQPDVWVGTDAEIQAARDESRRLSQMLLESGDCGGEDVNLQLIQQGCDIVILNNGEEQTRLTLDASLCPALVGPPGPQGPQGPQGIPGEDGADGIAGDYIQDIQLVDGVIRKRNQDGDISDVVDLCVDNCNWNCEWIFAAVSDIKPWQLAYGFWDSALKSQFYDDGLGVWAVLLTANLEFNDTFNVSHIEIDVFVPDGFTESPWKIIVSQFGGGTIYYENQPGIAFHQPMEFTVKIDVDEADQDMNGLTIAIEQNFTDDQVDDHIDIWIEAIRIVGKHPKARYDDGAIDRLICPDS